jgi:hypothetical protein
MACSWPIDSRSMELVQRPSVDLYVVIVPDLFVRRFTAVEVRFAPSDHRIHAEENIIPSAVTATSDLDSSRSPFTWYRASVLGNKKTGR